MIERIKEWVMANKKMVIIGAAVLGVGYFLIKKIRTSRNASKVSRRA